MKIFNRLLSFILVLIMIFMSLTACDVQNDDDKSDDDGINQDGTEDTGDDPDKVEYFIVTNSALRNSSDMFEGLSYLKSAINAVYGENTKNKVDTSFKFSKNDYTFIIGDTRLKESDALPTDLKINDYAYCVLENNVVVISGGSIDAIKNGITRFCKDVLGYTKDNAPAEPTTPVLTKDTKYTYNASYSGKKVLLNGIAIENFKIVIRSNNDIDTAEILVKELGKHNGHSVPVIQAYELKDTDKGVICLGQTGRDTSSTLPSTFDGYRVGISTKGGNYTAGIAGSNPTNFTTALNKYIGDIKSTGTTDAVNVTLPEKTFFDFDYQFTEGISTAWTRDDSKTKVENLAEGLVYHEYYYKDANGKPHIANVLYVDTEINTFTIGVPDEGDNYYYLKTYMRETAAAGYEVLAAVNGQRWETSGENESKEQGPQIKDGKVIWPGLYNKPYFGITTDGEYVMTTGGSQSIDASKFSVCLGGDVVLVNCGVAQHYSNITTDGHKYGNHPRTLIGFTDDYNMILVTIDGRQSHSNGATMENCAELMASLGCYMALSLDGGGSSEMAVRDSNGSYITKNKPSDGSSRGLVDAIVVVKRP